MSRFFQLLLRWRGHYYRAHNIVVFSRDTVGDTLRRDLVHTRKSKRVIKEFNNLRSLNSYVYFFFFSAS